MVWLSKGTGREAGDDEPCPPHRYWAGGQDSAVCGVCP